MAESKQLGSDSHAIAVSGPLVYRLSDRIIIYLCGVRSTARTVLSKIHVRPNFSFDPIICDTSLEISIRRPLTCLNEF